MKFTHYTLMRTKSIKWKLYFFFGQSLSQFPILAVKSAFTIIFEKKSLWDKTFSFWLDVTDSKKIGTRYVHIFAYDNYYLPTLGQLIWFGLMY